MFAKLLAIVLATTSCPAVLVYADEARDLDGLVRSGMELQKSGRFREAIDFYTRHLTEQESPWLYTGRAVVHLQLKDFETAAADCTRALRLHPGMNLAHSLRGICRMQARDFNGAIADFTMAAESDPTDLSAYYGRALVWLTLDHHELAAQDLTRCIELSPNEKQPYMLRAMCWGNTGHFQRAVEDLSKSIDLDRNWLDGYVVRAKMNVELQNFAAAQGDLEHVLKLQNNNVDALKGLASLLSTCADWQRRDYHQAIRIATAGCQFERIRLYENGQRPYPDQTTDASVPSTYR